MHSGRVPKLQTLVFILLLNLKSKNKKKYNHCLENGLPPLAVFSVEQEPAIEYGPTYAILDILKSSSFLPISDKPHATRHRLSKITVEAKQT